MKAKQKTEQDEISGREAARRWNVSPSVVDAQKKRGMPVLESGLLSWKVVDLWRRQNIIPELSGSYWHRMREGKITIAKEREPTADEEYDPMRDAQIDGFILGYTAAKAGVGKDLPDSVIRHQGNLEVGAELLKKVHVWLAGLDLGKTNDQA